MAAPPNSRILLTGAGGFVGRRLASRLSEWAGQDSRLFGLVRRSPAPPGFVGCVVDITDSEEIDAVIADISPTHIIHLAAQSSVGAAPEAASRTWQTNVCGVVALATACARHVPNVTLLYASSAEVYGASFVDGPVQELTELKPQGAYARSKAVAEAVLADVLPTTARRIVVRPFNHSGAGQDERFVLPSFASQIAAIEAGLLEPILTVGTLDAERDFMHVEDVCEAYIRLLDLAASLPFHSVFNVCTGNVISIRSLLDSMCSQTSVSVEIRVDPSKVRRNDLPRAAGSSDLLASVTGFRPRTDISSLVAEVLNFARLKILKASQGIA